MKPIFSFLTPIVLMMLLVSLSGYFQLYYKTNTTHGADPVTLQQLIATNKIFFVHTPGTALQLKNVRVGNEILYGDRDLMNPNHYKYLKPEGEKGNRFPVNQKEIALSEVHLYMNSSVNGTNPVHLVISQINRMDVYEMDKATTRDFRILSIIGIIIEILSIICLVIYAKRLDGYFTSEYDRRMGDFLMKKFSSYDNYPKEIDS
jgi:hypothetical protein